MGFRETGFSRFSSVLTGKWRLQLRGWLRACFFNLADRCRCGIGRTKLQPKEPNPGGRHGGRFATGEFRQLNQIKQAASLTAVRPGCPLWVRSGHLGQPSLCQLVTRTGHVSGRNLPGSTRLDAREFDHLGPFLGFLGDELCESQRASPEKRRRPTSSSRAFILGSARAVLISLLSLSTISAGVFFGAPMPNQPLAS